MAEEPKVPGGAGPGSARSTPLSTGPGGAGSSGKSTDPDISVHRLSWQPVVEGGTSPISSGSLTSSDQMRVSHKPSTRPEQQSPISKQQKVSPDRNTQKPVRLSQLWKNDIRPSMSWLFSFLRKWATVAGLGLLGACWTMIQIDEYALAEIILIIACIAFSVQLYDWAGIPAHKRATRAVKAVGFSVIAICLLFFGAVTLKKKGPKAWSNLLSVSPRPETAVQQIRNSEAAVVSTPTPLPETNQPRPIERPSTTKAENTVTQNVQRNIKSGNAREPQLPKSESGVGTHFDRRIFLKGGIRERLDKLLLEAGYKGPMQLDVLLIENSNGNPKIYFGQSDLTFDNGFPVDTASYYNFPHGAEATQIYLIAEADVRINISLKSKSK